MNGFKKFLMQGNVIDLAIAVVIGAAFNAIVQSFVADLLTPLISAFGGLPDFSSLKVTVGQSNFMYGNFVNAVISFLLVAAVVYFLIVKPYTHLTARAAAKIESKTRDCPECLSEIPKAASRCAFCSSEVVPV
ncbi:large conductance mechanosensitive channel protein MscL [Nonomuraea gerenzanensis]|uniref:Large-conductance mechanosensitive channel n=1 Tax=Nonomuraea gerenzanensis TaxID=93944 RepID=A0A1M4EQE8_9ACTN|nr:large conductance mechanosensitive channel protein MscL [Nonomuraea gerenzanensis]UBU12519.1 large conductance mechanosensitive channel protein MscL [Nonomuraea gerenzanensis]SBP01072.1 Large-conductance mechanosensitive channel [Nonomuraea gerenzanensis]